MLIKDQPYQKGKSDSKTAWGVVWLVFWCLAAVLLSGCGKRTGARAGRKSFFSRVVHRSFFEW